jgi:MFS family permease
MDNKHPTANSQTIFGGETNTGLSKNDQNEARISQTNSVQPKVVQEARDMKPITWFFLIISLLSSDFLFALDNTIVADVQPRIILTLGEIDKLPWVSVAFALGAIGVNLFWFLNPQLPTHASTNSRNRSKLFSQFDNKLLFVSGFVIFEIGSAICGAAPTMNALITGRAICGVGGMGLYLGTINITALLTTEVERPVYMSLVGLTWGLGTMQVHIHPNLGAQC